jgi:CheY-like chemotaxis protein
VSAPTPTLQPLSGRALLIVDDQPEVCEMLVDYLAHLGARVEAVTDGHAALEHLRRATFDALVTDLRMPGFDGAALVTAARQIDPGLVVVVMTGYPSFESALAVVRMGAHEYLRKPFDLAEVQRALTSGLAARENRPLPAEMAPSLTLEYQLAPGEIAASSGAGALVTRLTALAWEVPPRALDGAGLMRGLEEALGACTCGLRVTIDPAGVTVRCGDAEGAPVFEFARPVPPARAA